MVGYDYLKYALRLQKETASLYLPWIYAEAAVFVSMFLMTLYTLLELRDMITLYRTTRPPCPWKRKETSMEPVTLAVVSLAVLMLLLSFGVPIVFCFSGALAFMSIVGGVTMKGMMMWASSRS